MSDDPRHDPHLVETVANLLLYNVGECVPLTEILGLWPQVIGEAVAVLRRLGWQIEAQQGRKGYTLTGWQRPERWLHLDTVEREHRHVLQLHYHQMSMDEEAESCGS